jgi:hypothetical protein
MNKPKYTYKDWFDGKVYLQTGAIMIDKNVDKPMKAHLNDFSKNSLQKIQLKQKKIFDTKSADLFLKFKNLFKERYKKSEAKELLLKREIEDNRKILYLTPIQDFHFKNRSFTITKDDLIVMREFINNRIIKGEKNYDFVHSPNFKLQYEKITNDLVYARVTFDYYNWLIKFQTFLYKSKANSNKKNSPNAKKTELKTEKIKVKVIALIYFYNGEPINRVNCSEIAAKYYYLSKKSGDGLYQDYLKFSNTIRRVKLGGESRTKCIYKLKLIENAIDHLAGKAQENAKKEHQILEKAINEHEW